MKKLAFLKHDIAVTNPPAFGGGAGSTEAKGTIYTAMKSV